MANQFQIDGSTVAAPVSFSHNERYSPFDDDTGYHVPCAYLEAEAIFNAKSPADYAPWIAAADGQPHSLTCPKPDDDTTYDTYAGVIIEYENATLGNKLLWQTASFRITGISPDGLPAFGA